MPKRLREALKLLDRRDRALLMGVVFAQFCLALMDLVAVLLLGIVTTQVTTGVLTGDARTSPFTEILEYLPSNTTSVTALAVLAGALLVAKSAISFAVSRRTFHFLAQRQAAISTRLADELLSRPLLAVQMRSSQDNAFALTRGLQALMIGIVGQAVVVASETALVFVLVLGLLLIDPVVTVFATAYFALIVLALHFLLSRFALQLGRREAQLDTAAMASVQESIGALREISVTGRRPFYIRNFQTLVSQLTRVQADRTLVQAIGKYVFEVALILGAGLLVLGQAQSTSLAAALTTLVIFLAAASRITPALLRIQGSVISYKVFSGVAQPSLDLIQDLSNSEAIGQVDPEKLERLVIESSEGYPLFSGAVELKHITLQYPGTSIEALNDVSLSIPEGTSAAIVGPTGAGKTSLVDVVLGVILPDNGIALVSSVAPVEAIRTWPGALAYIPQATAVVNSSIRHNVALGLPDNLVNDERVWESLERAALADFVRGLDQGLDTRVGEHGVRVSGGQRQRLGIARALYTRPRLVVMDEGTSALDSQTEAVITDMLHSLSGQVTLVIVAHRLATIRHCDQIVYMSEGRVLGSGTFEELRLKVPEFDSQARLLGL